MDSEQESNARRDDRDGSGKDEQKEVLGHGHVLSTGARAPLPQTEFPEILLLSRCSHSPLRPQEILAIDAPSWHLLLQGLVWRGRVSLEPALPDLERMSAGDKQMTASPALSFHRNGREYRVRLYLSLNPPGKKLTPPPSGPSASRSGITKHTPLPYTVVLPFFHVVLPISFAELALQLTPLGQLALAAADSYTSVNIMRQRRSFPHADVMTLRELGQSFQFIAHQNNLAVEYSDSASFGDGDLSSSFPLRGITDRVRHSVRSRISSSSPATVQITHDSDNKDVVEDVEDYEHTSGLFNNPFSRRKSKTGLRKPPTRSLSHSSTSDIPTEATFITPFNLNDYA